MSWFEEKKNQWQPRLRQFASVLWLRLTAAGGLAVMAFIALALLSYDAQDASINTSSSRAIANWMGSFGAFTADLIMQLVGHAAFSFAEKFSSRSSFLLLPLH